MKKVILLSLFALYTTLSQLFAANVTAPNAKVCTASYTSVGNVVITETAVNDIGSTGTSKYLFINAPTGFEFNPGTGSVGTSGADLSNSSVLFVSAATVAIYYEVSATATMDVITISGLQIKATNVAGTTGNFVFATGSSAIAGLTVNSTTLIAVQSALTAINLASVTAKCNNDAAVALSGTHTLAGSVGLTSQTYSGTGVSGSNFNPTTAGTGNHTVTYIVVTNSPTCTFTKTTAIDVNAAPIVTMITEETSGTVDNDGIVCPSTPITFTGYGASTYKFYKTSGPTLLSSTSPYTTSSLTSGDIIYVEGTATNGCKDNSPNKPITVNSNPAAPTFNPSNSTFATTDDGFWLDTLGSPSEEANRTAGAPSYFTGEGVFYNSSNQRYYFYPSVAGDGNHDITYHYVDPSTGCENTTTKQFTVGTGVSAGAIQGIQTKYCSYEAASTIYIDFCEQCFLGCTNYGGMQYSLDGGASWVNMVETSSSSLGACGFGTRYRHNYSLDPATLGAGIRLVRYYYTTYVFFSGTVTKYSNPQSTTVYDKPIIAITTNLATVNCSNTAPSVLSYTANGASGVAVFSSTLPGFITYTAPNYSANWSVLGTTVVYGTAPIKLKFTDNISGCVDSVTSTAYAALKPPAPSAYTGTFFGQSFPINFCKNDYVYGVSNRYSAAATVQWIKDAPTNAPSYIDNFYPQYYDFSYYPRGPITANETYFLKQYLYSTCVSDASGAYVFTVNDPVSVLIGQYSNVCSNQTVNLNKLQKTGPAVTQTWSTVSAPQGSFDNAASNSPVYTLNATDIARGSVTFRVTTSDPDGANGCPYVIKDTIVYINELPTISASSSAATYCSNNLMFLSASVNKSSALPVTWYKGPIVSGDQTGISTPNSINTYFSPNGSEKTGGNITFYVESSDPDGPTGPCSAVNDNVTIAINAEAVVDAGVEDTICQGSTISLSGTCTRIGGATLGATWQENGPSPWSQVIAAGTNPKTATYTPTAAEELGTVLTFTLLSDDPDGAGPCLAASDNVKIQIDKAPTVDAGSDQSLCSNSIISLNAISTGASSVTWYKSTVGGTQVGLATPTFSNTLYTATPGEMSGATVTFVVQTDDPFGPCVAVQDLVNVAISPEVVVDAGSDFTVCGNQDINLSGTCTKLGGADLGASWYKGSLIAAIPATTNPKATTYSPSGAERTSGGLYSFTLLSDDPDGVGPCFASSDVVNVTINPAPTVSAGNDSVYCSNVNPTLLATLGGTASNITWTKNAGSGTIADPNNSLTSYFVAPGDFASGTALVIDFTATTNDPDGAGPCVPANDVVQITLNPHLTVNPGSDIEICASSVISLNGSVKLGGIDRVTPGVNTWKTFDGAGTFTLVGPSNFTGTYNASGVITSSGVVIPGTGELGVGDSIFVYLVSSDPDAAGPCLADSARINVKINPLPITHFDPLTKVEYCGNDDALFLYGNLGSNFNAPGLKSSASFSGGTFVLPFGSAYQFHPKLAYNLNPNGGPRTITYTYRDDKGCENHVDTTFNVYPYPLVNFTISTLCEKDTITFTQTSSIGNGVYPSVNSRFDWYIDGDSIQNTLPPTVYSTNTPVTQYSFTNYGLHNIKLFVTSTNGAGTINCYNKKDSTRVFGPYPNTDFTWDRACSVDSVVFTNQTTIPTGYTNSIIWSMNGAGAYKNATSATSQNPHYKFDAPGIYNVALDATTNVYNCKKIVTKEVYVLPTISVTGSDPYDTTFANAGLNWAPSGTNYSWDWGTISGKSVINAPNNVWVTNLTGNYNIGESSYLNSPCFNFSALDKPMIALKLWNNSTNLAGAVLEATKGYGNPWVTIGKIGDGLNWYNTSGIVGLIGTNTANNPLAEGFSGENTNWITSRIGLSQYALEDTLVRFRILFASSSVNDPLNQRDGIAFDSVWIGNRSKVVMLDHFTNASASVTAQTTPANAAVDNIRAQRPSDVAVAAFHTSFPNADQYSAFNFADPGSRVLYYGVASVPRTVMDGNGYNGNVYSGGTEEERLDVEDIDSKALETARFSLDINSNFTTGAVNIGVKATYTVDNVLPKQVLLHTIIVEDSASGVNSMNSVVRKMLPNAAGTVLGPTTWAKDSSASVFTSWTHSLPANSKLGVVAYVQDIETKEIYQAKYVRGSQTSVIIDGTDDATASGMAVQLFPNPATDEAVVLYGDNAAEELQWQLMDGVGKSVDAGSTSVGSQGFVINTRNQAAGVYTVRIFNQNGSVSNKKLVIIK